jgi:hypothetical protein
LVAAVMSVVLETIIAIETIVAIKIVVTVEVIVAATAVIAIARSRVGISTWLPSQNR